MMKENNLHRFLFAFFLSMIIMLVCSCSYMKTDLGNEAIDVSISQIKTSTGKEGVILTFNTVSSQLEIPETLQEIPVVKIVFADATNMSSLVSITIPASVTEIDTFEKASSLKDVNYKDEKNQTHKVNLPDNLAYMPSFKDCSSITEIVIPSEIKEIPESCFEGCTKLVKVYKKSSDSSSTSSEENAADTLKGIKTIGKRAFYNCSALKSIALETTGITALDEYAFYNCTSLTEITLPDSVKKIDDEAFESCKKLKTVNGFKNVEEVGKKVFYSCELLESIELNPEINKVEKQNENGETKVIIKIPDNLFNGCEKLQSIIIPDGVTTLGSSIFANCKALTGLTVPEGIEIISSNFCYGCVVLESLSLPSTLMKIDSSAIKDCNGLERLICKAENPPSIDATNSLSAKELKNDLIIYVPDNSVDKYKSETAWGKVFAFSEDNAEENTSEEETPDTSENAQKQVKILIKGLSELP